MFRQHSSRHQRSKGFKLKHALQICVLLGVCIWLLYQVKHSHDKKKELEERKSAGITEPHIMKFGRKDLPDNVAGKDSHEEEENEGEEDEHDLKKDAGEEEEDKGDGMDTLEENDQEKDEESKGMGEDDVDENDRENGEGKVAGDDELDENDQENDEHENGAGEDELDEKKGNGEEGKAMGGESDEKIKEVVDLLESNENEGKSDNLLLKGMDDEDDTETDSQEARERHYKGDDASSAVVKSAEAIQSEENHQDGGKEDEGKEDEENTENKPEMSNGDKVDGNSVTEKIGESGNYSVSDAPGAVQEQVDTAILNPILNLTNVVDDDVHVNGTLLNSTIPELNQKSTASELSKEMEQRNSTLEDASNHTVEDGGKILQESSTEVPQAVTEESDQPNPTLEVGSNHTVEEEDSKIPQENSTVLPEMVPDLSQKNESENVVLDGDHYKNNAKIMAESKILESENNMNPGNATVELTGKTNMTVNAGDSDDTSNDSSALDDDIKAILKDAGEPVTDDTGESSKEDTNSDDQKDVQTDLSTLEEIEMDATPEDMAAE